MSKKKEREKGKMSDFEKSRRAFSENIKRLCGEKKMTQKELAEKTGIASVSVSRYCIGARIPNATTLYSMARALECTMEDLMEGVEVTEAEDGQEATEACQEPV